MEWYVWTTTTSRYCAYTTEKLEPTTPIIMTILIIIIMKYYKCLWTTTTGNTANSKYTCEPQRLTIVTILLTVNTHVSQIIVTTLIAKTLMKHND